MPSSPSRPAPRRPSPPSPLLEHDAWLGRLALKYATPRAVLARQLSPRGALEHEIGTLIAEVATQAARDLFAADLPAPGGDSLFDRAVRAVHARLEERRAAEEEAERQRRYAASDDELALLRAEIHGGER